MRGLRSSGPTSAISPTGHYTGTTWVRAGLSDPALATRTGRLLHDSLRVPFAVAGLVGLPTLDGMLLGRHLVIDAILADAVDAGLVTQVVEVASGLSPRGLRFSRRYGAALTYIEGDLPAMAATKRSRLERIDALGPHHRVVTIDALASEGPSSLPAIVAGLDCSRGLAMITEGLVNYLALPDLTSMWRQFASVLGGFAHGLYLSDIGLQEGNRDPLVLLAGGILSTFVRRPTPLHFASAGDAADALRAAGFATARLHRPDLHPATAALRRDPGMRRVQVVEARTAAPPGGQA